MREFLATILARPSWNFDREYLEMEFHSKASSNEILRLRERQEFYYLKATGRGYSFLYEFSASLSWSFRDFLKFQTVFVQFICDEILWLGEIYRAI